MSDDATAFSLSVSVLVNCFKLSNFVSYLSKSEFTTPDGSDPFDSLPEMLSLTVVSVCWSFNPMLGHPHSVCCEHCHCLWIQAIQSQSLTIYHHDFLHCFQHYIK